jgi:hypothetical protein
MSRDGRWGCWINVCSVNSRKLNETRSDQRPAKSTDHINHNVILYVCMTCTSYALPDISDLPVTPPAGGILPYWLLLTCTAAIYNSVQNYFVLWQSKEVYSGAPHQSQSSFQCR